MLVNSIDYSCNFYRRLTPKWGYSVLHTNAEMFVFRCE
jgi:hypothetical protein